MIVEEIKDPVQAIIVGWVDRKGQRPQEDRQRIKKSQKLHAKERRRTQGNQQVVFDAPPARRESPAATSDHLTETIKRTAKRADPTAKEATKENRQQKDKESGPEELPAKGARGEEISQRRQGINTKE